MVYHPLKDRKRAQKEAEILRQVSLLFMQIMQDDDQLSGTSITQVKLSPDKGSCAIFFYSVGGFEEFKKKLGRLILYKPSLRKALSQLIRSRYTPDLVFKYDQLIEKRQRLDGVLMGIMDKDKNMKDPFS